MSLLKSVICLAAAVTFLGGAALKIGTAPLVTHEWGTFTSVAREDGAAVQWAPLLGPGDLPCFVTRAREGTTLGRYEILVLIGAGGMGEVWRAGDTRLDRIRALGTGDY